MNYADSDRLRSVLIKAGIKEADMSGKANVIILNTCTVRQKAADKALGYNKQIAKRKKQNPNVKFVLTGCLVEKTSEKKDKIKDPLFKSLELLDIALRIEDVEKLPEMLGVEKSLDCADDYLKILPSFENKLTAIIPIMTGCNNFCTYCAVPYARGRERSRSQEEVIDECKKALVEGSKEILLVGQNVNSYEYDFPELLRKINALPGRFWLRFTSSHPKDFSEDLLATMVECEKIPPHLHLPVQSGCDKILELMKRNYNTDDYRRLIEMYRKKIPRGALTTDWIVGFCGESEKDFEKSLDFCREIGFDQIYFAQYSMRPHTFATKNLIDDVTLMEKRRRWHKFNDVMKEIAFEKNKAEIGRETVFLVEKRGQYDFKHGRTAENKMAKMKNGEAKVGDFWKVKIVEADNWLLKSKPIKKLPTS